MDIEEFRKSNGYNLIKQEVQESIDYDNNEQIRKWRYQLNAIYRKIDYVLSVKEQLEMKKFEIMDILLRLGREKAKSEEEKILK